MSGFFSRELNNIILKVLKQIYITCSLPEGFLFMFIQAIADVISSHKSKPNKGFLPILIGCTEGAMVGILERGPTVWSFTYPIDVGK